MINVYGFKINDDGKYDRDTYATSCGDFYLHGELAMINGYDLCGIKEMPQEGIHKCNVYIDGCKYKGNLFCWLAPFADSYRKRGYVVIEGDTAYEYALSKYKEKAEYL